MKPITTHRFTTRKQSVTECIAGIPPRRRPARWIVAALALTHAAGAAAYVGPGAGLTAIGSFLALLAAVVLGIVGFLWYPVKRLMRRLRAGRNPQVQTQEDAAQRVKSDEAAE